MDLDEQIKLIKDVKYHFVKNQTYEELYNSQGWELDK
jgi:hypothetical protein